MRFNVGILSALHGGKRKCQRDNDRKLVRSGIRSRIGFKAVTHDVMTACATDCHLSCNKMYLYKILNGKENVSIESVLDTDIVVRRRLMHMVCDMRVRSEVPRQSVGIARVAHWVLCLWFGVFCTGCLALAVGAAGGAAGAVYVMGKLKEELNYPVPVVHEATVAAMNDLGLKLSEDKGDKLSAHLESEFSDGAHVWIDVESLAESRCRLTIRVGLTGDEARARKIHKSIKQHLPPARE